MQLAPQSVSAGEQVRDGPASIPNSCQICGVETRIITGLMERHHSHMKPNYLLCDSQKHHTRPHKTMHHVVCYITRFLSVEKHQSDFKSPNVELGLWVSSCSYCWRQKTWHCKLGHAGFGSRFYSNRHRTTVRVNVQIKKSFINKKAETVLCVKSSLCSTSVEQKSLIY